MVLVTGLWQGREQSTILGAKGLLREYTVTSTRTHQTHAGEKESGLFKSQQPEKMEDSHPKDHLNLSVQTEVFIRRGKTEQRDQVR